MLGPVLASVRRIVLRPRFVMECALSAVLLALALPAPILLGYALEHLRLRSEGLAGVAFPLGHGLPGYWLRGLALGLLAGIPAVFLLVSTGVAEALLPSVAQLWFAPTGKWALRGVLGVASVAAWALAAVVALSFARTHDFSDLVRLPAALRSLRGHAGIGATLLFCVAVNVPAGVASWLPVALGLAPDRTLAYVCAEVPGGVLAYAGLMVSADLLATWADASGYWSATNPERQRGQVGRE